MTKSAKRSKKAGPLGADARRAQRENRKQRRQERQAVDEGAYYAERHAIAQDVKGRRIRGVQAQEPDPRRKRSQKHRPGVDAKRFGNRRIFLQTAPHFQENARDDVDGIRDGYHHDDDRHAGVCGAEHRADPACGPHGADDGEQENGDYSQGAEKRAQENNRETHDDEKHDWEQVLHVVLCGILESPFDDDGAGQVIGHVRVARSRLLQNGFQIIGYLDHRGVLVFGQDEGDGYSTHPPVAGDEASGDFLGAERDFPDSREVCVFQRARVVYERLDDQVVPLRPAVGVVGEGINPAGVRRLPRGLGQLLDGAERLFVNTDPLRGSTAINALSEAEKVFSSASKARR